MLRNSHLVNTSILKSASIPLRSTSSLPLAHSLNGGLTSCIVSIRGHGYIIVAIHYFTKWVEAMPTYAEDGKTATVFLFNHIIDRFGVPQSIVTDHTSYFCNQMMEELSAKLGFCHVNSTPYYLQTNGQVEAINKVLKLCSIGWLEIINPTSTTFFSLLLGLSDLCENNY